MNVQPKPAVVASVSKLLAELFTNKELATFIHELPDSETMVSRLPSTEISHADFCFEVTNLLFREGLLGQKILFEQLRKNRPHRGSEIETTRITLFASSSDTAQTTVASHNRARIRERLKTCALIALTAINITFIFVIRSLSEEKTGHMQNNIELRQDINDCIPPYTRLLFEANVETSPVDLENPIEDLKLGCKKLLGGGTE